MENNIHKCPECGKELPFKAYLTLPGDYTLTCPHCKSKLKPTLADIHRVVPVTLFVLIIFTAIKQKAELTGFLIFVGVLTVLTYLILLIGAYYFLAFKKIDQPEE